MNVRRHVRRLLARHRVDGGGPIYPEFISFEDGRRPTWWTTDIVGADWAEVYGVHEKSVGHRANSIVVTENGLGLLTEGDTVWVRYDEIDRCDRLFKEPLSKVLTIWTTAGKKIELPFNDAGAFTFVRFLSRAMWEWRQQAKRG